MLKIKLDVTYNDGREACVTAGPATQVAFEREHSVGIVTIAEKMMLSHIYWIAWHASKPGLGFDEWLESVESIDFDVSSLDPTKPAPPAA